MRDSWQWSCTDLCHFFLVLMWFPGNMANDYSLKACCILTCYTPPKRPKGGHSNPTTTARSGAPHLRQGTGHSEWSLPWTTSHSGASRTCAPRQAHWGSQWCLRGLEVCHTVGLAEAVLPTHVFCPLGIQLGVHFHNTDLLALHVLWPQFKAPSSPYRRQRGGKFIGGFIRVKVANEANKLGNKWFEKGGERIKIKKHNSSKRYQVGLARKWRGGTKGSMYYTLSVLHSIHIMVLHFDALHHYLFLSRMWEGGLPR